MDRFVLQRSPSALAAVLPVLVLLSAIPVLTVVSGTLYEGSACFHEGSQMRGVCKLLPYCSWAVKERRSNLYPQTCSFVGYLPVVCCPYTRTHDPPHLPLRPVRPFLPGEAGPMAGAGAPAPAEVDAESPLLPLQLEIGGPLGPLPTAPQRPGYRPPEQGPDDLQQEAEGLGLPPAPSERLGQPGADVDPLGFLVPGLQLGDGSAAFAVGRAQQRSARPGAAAARRN